MIETIEIIVKNDVVYTIQKNKIDNEYYLYARYRNGSKHLVKESKRLGIIKKYIPI